MFSRDALGTNNERVATKETNDWRLFRPWTMATNKVPPSRVNNNKKNDNNNDINKPQCVVDDKYRQLLLDVSRIIQYVPVKDRKYRLKKYKRCFVASEAVDLIVGSGYVDDRDDAVRIAETLRNDYGMFSHVVDKGKVFEDSFLFFRFKRKKGQGGDTDDDDDVAEDIEIDECGCGEEGTTREGGSRNDRNGTRSDGRRGGDPPGKRTTAPSSPKGGGYIANVGHHANYYAQGVEHMKHGDLDMAYQSFARASSHADENDFGMQVKIRERLGDVALEREDHGTAILHYDGALEARRQMMMQEGGRKEGGSRRVGVDAAKAQKDDTATRLYLKKAATYKQMGDTIAAKDCYAKAFNGFRSGG